MSIKGQSIQGTFAAGAHLDFGVGSAGLANALTAGFTIAVLAKQTASNWGLFSGYNSLDGTSPTRQFFLSNNSGGRLFGDGDFSGGFPDVGADADGLNDGVWRWHVMSKAAGTTHYRMHYADLATLTWAHGESAAQANHTDNATAAQMFSTFAIYPQGFDAGDIAAIAVWDSNLSDGNIVSSCTKLAADLNNVTNPKGGWLCKPNGNRVIKDFTGGGADEIARPSMVVSASPPGWSSLLDKEETLWLPTDGPSGGDFLDASDGVPNIATGVSFTVSQSGTVSAIRFFATTNASTGGGNYQVNLHEVTADDNTPAGTLLGSSTAVAASNVVNGAWNEFPLITPVTVQPGHVYRASLYSGTSGRYVATLNYFVGVDHTSAGGHITAHHSGDNPVGFGSVNNGVFTIGGGSPTDMPFHTTGANYWIDPVILMSDAEAHSGTTNLAISTALADTGKKNSASNSALSTATSLSTTGHKGFSQSSVLTLPTSVLTSGFKAVGGNSALSPHTSLGASGHGPIDIPVFTRQPIMRGFERIRQIVSTYLQVAMPYYIDVMRLDWELDQYQLPYIASVDVYDPPLMTNNQYPGIAMFASNDSGHNRTDYNADGSQQYISKWSVRILLMARSPLGPDGSTWLQPEKQNAVRVCSDLTRAMHAALLQTPSCGRPDVLRQEEGSLTTDYLEPTMPNTQSKRWVAASVTNVDFWLTEDTYALPYGQAATIIRNINLLIP